MIAIAATAQGDASAHPVAFYEDPTFWVAVSIILFVILAGKKLYTIAVEGLDKRAAGIRQQIEEAATLREEAQQLLAENQLKQRQALQEAEQIVAKAREEADRMRERAAQELEHALARRRQLAEERIAQAEAKAIAEVKGIAADIAVEAAQALLTEQLTGELTDRLINNAIEEIPSKLN